MKNILFFGDSLTAGYGLGDTSQESYPALIQKKINSAGLYYHVINGGISGDTTAGGLSRLSYWLTREIDVFVLELGINDIIRGIQPTQISINLQQIINTAAKDLGLSTKFMQSGAGHDSQEIARIAPVAMIFIPSVGGISHSFKEFSKPTDIGNGANVLLKAILSIDKG